MKNLFFATIAKWIKSYHVFLIVFLFYVLTSPIYMHHSDLTGDEPHYLAVTQSIYAHHTINLYQFYQGQEWKKYVPGYPDLDKHVVKNLSPQKLISAHQPLFSVIILPSYVLGQKLSSAGFSIAGINSGDMPKLMVMLFVNLIAALIIQNIFFHLRDNLKKGMLVAEVVSYSFALTYPLLIFAHLMFSDALAALLFIYGFRGKIFWLRLLSIILLPWAHFKYFFVFAILGLKIILEKQKMVIVFSSMAVSTVLFGIFSKIYYGSFTPANYISNAGKLGGPEGIAWLLIERSAGLLNYAPFLVLVFLGLGYYYYKNRKEFIFFILICLAVLIPNGVFSDWMGGMSPPARYLVPIIPLFSLPIAFILNHFKPRAVFWSFFLFLLYFSLRVSYRGIKMPTDLYLRRPDNASHYFGQIFGFNPFYIFPDGGTSNAFLYISLWLAFCGILAITGFLIAKKQKILKKK